MFIITLVVVVVVVIVVVVDFFIRCAMLLMKLLSECILVAVGVRACVPVFICCLSVCV